MALNKVMVCILNYNQDSKALDIYNSITINNIEKYLIDSSGVVKADFIQSDIPYYTGNFNKASELFLKSDCDHCFYICSDMTGDFNKAIAHIQLLDKSIGIYSPQITGRYNKYWYDVCKTTYCAEGMAIAVNRHIIRIVHPFKYSHGWAIDVYKCYIAYINGYKVFIDRDVSLHHPEERNYSTEKAYKEMKYFINSDKGFRHFVRTKSKAGIKERIMRKIKKYINIV